MVMQKHPYIDSKIRLVSTHRIPGTDITIEEYVTTPNKGFRLFRIISSQNLTQKLPPKTRTHGTWWLDTRSNQFIEDQDLLTSVPISRTEYEQRYTKGIKGFVASKAMLSSILDVYSMLPNRGSYDATDFFLTRKRNVKSNRTIGRRY